MWREVAIGDVVLLQRGHDITRAEQSVGQVPVISSGGISSYHSRAMYDGPGVVLGRKGVVGSVFYTEVPYWPHDTTLFVKDFKGNHPRFVYYFFKKLAREIALMDVGSANPTLNRNHVHPKRILWPDPVLQREIASVLGALDDKIELNRRINDTLEQMARALFRSWFIDFDPVRAKSDGRPTGLPAELDALFPSEFEDSPLGEIPKGWRAGTMEDVAVCRRRSVATTSIADDEPYVGLEHIGKRSLALTNWGYGADVASQKSRFQIGEILFGKLRPYFHKVCIAPISGVCSTDILVVDATEPGLAGFVALALSEASTIEFVTGSSGGTRMPRTSWGDLARVPLVIPMDEVATAFGVLIRENLELLRKSVFEIKYLAEQRDFLLPRLFSGQIEVGPTIASNPFADE